MTELFSKTFRSRVTSAALYRLGSVTRRAAGSGDPGTGGIGHARLSQYSRSLRSGSLTILQVASIHMVARSRRW
ncbi:hypothetical protein Q0Z83_048690 [Actinoplanes sichuanensis]|nr:hypothetical protein Q0Z83_048690 [Actinoplanes sichuanensis]